MNDLLDEAIYSAGLNFTFRSQALPVPPDQRLSWRLPLLLLMLSNLRGGKASFKQLAIVSYALNASEGQVEVEQAINDDFTESRVFVKYEPGLPYLLAYGVARGLVAISTSQKYSLTEHGVALAEEIAVNDAFESQIAFLRRVGKKLSDAAADRLLSPRLNVERFA